MNAEAMRLKKLLGYIMQMGKDTHNFTRPEFVEANRNYHRGVNHLRQTDPREYEELMRSIGVRKENDGLFNK